MYSRLAALILGGCLVSGSAFANLLFTAGGTNSLTGNNEAASANFSLTGTTLTLVLTNTGATPTKYQNGDVLTGIFFDGNFTGATPGTASLTNGSSFVNGSDGSASSGSPGPNWAFATGLAGAPDNLQSGISAAGLNLFGSGNFNNCSATSSCQNLDGVPYGIVTSGFNGGLNFSPLEKDSMTFTIDVGSAFSLNSIDTVVFQYGTALTDFQACTGSSCVPNSVPETSSVMSFTPLLLAGLVIFARFRKPIAPASNW